MNDRPQRNPRFYRSDDPPPLRLTARDIDILRLVAKHRLVRSTIVLSAISGSRQNILRRLQRLYHCQYLDRPRAQIDYYSRGSEPMVYGLGRKGFDAVLGHTPTLSSIPIAMAGSVKPQFMRHTLLVAEIMQKLERDCAAGGVTLLDEDALRGTLAAARASADPFAWSVAATVDGVKRSIGVRPDRALGLAAPGGAEALVFLEADRGTMPVTRSDFEQNSLHKKMLGYYETWRQGQHRSLFGSRRFIVLFALENQGRIANALKASMRFNGGGGSGLFAFAAARAMAGAENSLCAPIVTGRGRDATLSELLASQPVATNPSRWR